MKRHRDSFRSERALKHTADTAVPSTPDDRESVSANAATTNQESISDGNAGDNDEDADQSLDIASRAYQLEMLQQSLQQNVIVAVRAEIHTTLMLKTDCKTTADGHRQWKNTNVSFSQATPLRRRLLTVLSAVLRIRAELEKPQNDKVGKSAAAERPNLLTS